MSGARQRLIRIALAFALLAAALACGSGDEGGSSAPPPEPTPAPEPAPAPEPEPTPELEPAAEPSDVTPGVGNAQAGAEPYATFCASCHGDDGCGDGPLASTLDPKPAKHCDGEVMGALDDAYLVQVITEGGPAVGKSSMMAPWGGSLSEQQILDVVAFIRTLAK